MCSVGGQEQGLPEAQMTPVGLGMSWEEKRQSLGLHYRRRSLWALTSILSISYRKSSPESVPDLGPAGSLSICNLILKFSLFLSSTVDPEFRKCRAMTQSSWYTNQAASLGLSWGRSSVMTTELNGTEAGMREANSWAQKGSMELPE